MRWTRERPDHVRVAVVSTPRSGNMWLRRLLVALFELEERSAHTPDEVAWDDLPERCVLQLHWPRTRGFARTLRRHGFRVVVAARHPLDVLLSILQFAPHEPETARWLDGAGGDEASIIGADPVSDAFVDYARSARARALLQVSPQWWRHADAAVRYEDLLQAPERRLADLAAALRLAPVIPPEEATARVTFARLSAEARNRHFWQGRAGHWQELLPAATALAAAEPYTEWIHRLGYEVAPDPTLTTETALARWRERAAA